MSKVEVYLDQDQIKNLKSILNQSELGIHVLFDNHAIAEAFKNEQSEEEFFEKPDWLGQEVTGNKKFYNSALSQEPFKSW